MRIATSTLYASAVSNMNSSETQIAQLQQQVSTGKRVVNPADDPVAAASAVRINQEIARASDLTNNRQTVESTLSTVDTTLSSVNTLLTNVKSELVSAGSGTLSASDRKVLAQQLQTQMQDLLGYANTQDGNGEYLFSGFKTATQAYSSGNFASATAAPGNSGSGSFAPGSNSAASTFPGNGTLTISAYTAPATPGGSPTFTYSVTGLSSGNVSNVTSTNGQVSVGGQTFTLSGTPAVNDSFALGAQATQYQGDSGVRNVEVYPGRAMGTNLTGNQLFDSVPTGNGVFATSVAAGNSGSGIITQGTVTNTAQLTSHSYKLQFDTVGAAATNSGGVTLAPNSTTGTPTSSDKYQLSFTGSGASATYSVVDSTSGATVSSAQPFTSGSPITVNGVTFALNGAPANGDSFSIGSGAASTYSVYDTTSNTAVLSGQAYTAGNAIQFAGMSFSISGAPNVGDSFQTQPSTSTSVFTVMQNAINALNSSGSGLQANTVLANALATANTGIDSAMAQVSLGQTTVGGRMQELKTLDTSGAQLKIQYQQSLSQLTDVDMTAAISSLSQAQISLTAAQKSFVSVQNLSLFNYIQ
ncbi:MAG: flagellar hook-associated protein FlgL [Pseudomonadota bacterium]|nr:flagellar hook-associated protein FlgL [Pseudomonadota bacterium]